MSSASFLTHIVSRPSSKGESHCVLVAKGLTTRQKVAFTSFAAGPLPHRLRYASLIPVVILFAYLFLGMYIGYCRNHKECCQTSPFQNIDVVVIEVKNACWELELVRHLGRCKSKSDGTYKGRTSTS